MKVTKNIVIFGYGYVGSTIADYMMSNEITVVDPKV